jgi:hypothetical protein
MKLHFAQRASRPLLLLLGALLLVGLPAISQVTIPTQQVTFAQGDKVTYKGALNGRDKDAMDYLVHVKSGQTLSVALSASRKSTTYFNVLPPGSEEALYRGEIEGRASWESQVDATGDYVVRVFLNRAASRKGSKSTYEVTVSVF